MDERRRRRRTDRSPPSQSRDRSPRYRAVRPASYDMTPSQPSATDPPAPASTDRRRDTDEPLFVFGGSVAAIVAATAVAII